MIRSALDRLEHAGIPFATRGEQAVDDPPPGGDVDILVAVEDLSVAKRTLSSAGFHWLEVPGHHGHRFFLAFDGERSRWLKLDINLVPSRLGWDLSARDPESLRSFAGYRVGAKADPGRAERAWSVLARRRPLGVRRRGPVVAMLGPDGSGKGTVIAALVEAVPANLKPIYMGKGGGVSNSQYRVHGRRRARPAGRRARAALGNALEALPARPRAVQDRLLRVMRSSLRTWAAYPHAWQGDIVICDRHPVEALALEEDRGPGSRLERRLLRLLIPWPDAVIVLDAPGHLLFARKGEHSPDQLDRWRRRYREFFGPRGASFVSTTVEIEDSVAAASAIVWRALGERRGW